MSLQEEDGAVTADLHEAFTCPCEGFIWRLASFGKRLQS
jgi:hypothetical protein